MTLLRHSLLCLCGLACARSATVVPPATPETVYTEFERIATDSLWPGFHPRRTAVAIYDGHDTWLFGHPGTPEGFADTAMPGPRTYPGRHRVVTANTTTTLAGVPTAVLLLRTDVNPDPSSWAGIAVHESFHTFQASRHPDWRPNEVDLFTYPRDDVDNLTDRRLETEGFRRSLLASDDSMSVCWARVALAARTARFERLAPPAATYERESERLEGLADYVELLATGGRVDLPPTGFPPEAIRARGYRAGTTMAVLLDRFAPGWQDRIEAGDPRYLDDILMASLPAQRCTPIPEVNRDSVGAVAQASIDSMHARLASIRESFVHQAGWTVTIVAAQAPLFPAQFDPLNVDLLSDREVLHRRFVRLENDVGWVETFGQPAMTVGRPSHPLFAGVTQVTVAGLGRRPTLRRDGPAVVLEAGGLEGRFLDADVHWTPGALRVHLRADHDTEVPDD